MIHVTFSISLLEFYRWTLQQLFRPLVRILGIGEFWKEWSMNVSYLYLVYKYFIRLFEMLHFFKIKFNINTVFQSIKFFFSYEVQHFPEWPSESKILLMWSILVAVYSKYPCEVVHLMNDRAIAENILGTLSVTYKVLPLWSCALNDYAISGIIPWIFFSRILFSNVVTCWMSANLCLFQVFFNFGNNQKSCRINSIK